MQQQNKDSIRKKRKVKISFTKSEISALRGAAGNMSDDLEYFNFLPPKEYKAFTKGFETGMQKLREALSQFE